MVLPLLTIVYIKFKFQAFCVCVCETDSGENYFSCCSIFKEYVGFDGVKILLCVTPNLLRRQSRITNCSYSILHFHFTASGGLSHRWSWCPTCPQASVLEGQQNCFLWMRKQGGKHMSEFSCCFV